MVREPDKAPKERLYNVVETSALIARLLLALEKHHGAELLNKLKSNAKDNNDLTWVLNRDDSNDLVATSLILDAIHAIEKSKKTENAALPNSDKRK